jgi:hemolysin activation/secretion protein
MMMKNCNIPAIIINTVFLGMSLSFSNFALSAPTIPQINSAVRSILPGSVEPGVVSGTFAQPVTPRSRTLPPAVKPKQTKAANPLGAAAERLKFKLTHVILKGNTIYSNATLSALYKDKIGKTITVAQLQGIVQDVTNYYRNNGYILSRAVLPPQHVNKGSVVIQIVEGYIDQVRVAGKPKGTKSLLQAYGNRIAKHHPLQVKTMEHYLLLSNEIPGLQVKAVLEPSKTQTAASDLNLVADAKTFSGYLSYDNYGTRYIGPQQWSGGIELDSIFRSGDSTQLNFATTTKPKELRFGGFTHNTPLGTNGTRLIVAGNHAITQPAFVLAPLSINGTSDTVYGLVQYPLIRTRSQSLTLDGSFNYIDSKVTTFEPPILLYNDHLRTLRFGGNYYLSDSWYGGNSADLHFEQGLPILGATPESAAESGFTSRVGGSGHFTKMSAQASRLQQLGATRYSIYALVKGQYALEPLLASEQFDFGGAQAALGRAYDSAEIIGDRGLAGSLEFRVNVSPQKFLLQSAQLYVFYDAGVIFNLKNVINQKTKQSATSTGVGSRFFFTRNLSGNLMLTQPLTKQVSALELIGNGRKPRLFFSLTASV